jgi:hypothetical protein
MCVTLCLCVTFGFLDITPFKDIPISIILD